MLENPLPKESREATMCKGFGSTLIGPALQCSRSLEKTSDGLYDILRHRVEPLLDYIACFNQEKVAVRECSIPTAISAIKRGLLPDGGLYKELTMYPCKTMEDVLSRAWEQVKWEENVASRTKTQPKHDQRSARSDRGDQEERFSQRGSKDSGSRNMGRFQYRPQEKEEGMYVSTWPDFSHLSISTPELVNALRQMGQQVKWPPRMKALDSFRNPELCCDFHRDHGHKTEDNITLRIEVNKLLQKGHLLEFLSEKAKAHLSKETAEKSKGATPTSPLRQDRVIHVISGGSEERGVSHTAAKKSMSNAKHGLETTQPKRLLVGTDEISFTAKEQEKILAPHHDALVISLTVANCLVKRILEDNGSSSNIIFHMAYHDLGLEESALTRKVTPLIGFSGEVKQTVGEAILPVYAEGVNMSTKFLVVDCQSAYNMILGRPWIHDMGAVPSTLQQMVKFPTPWGIRSSQDPRPPPHIDKITKNLIRYQPVVSRINNWGTSTSRRPPQRVHRTYPEQRAPHRRRRETLSQAGGLRTWYLRWMNMTTRFMEVLKTFINRRHWSPNTKGRGMKRVSTTVPGPKKEAEPCRRRRNPPAWTLVPKHGLTTWVQETFNPGQPLMTSGIRALHRSIKLLVEFGVGRRLVAWAIKLPCIDVVNMLQWACVRSLVVPLIPMTWKWIIRKNHHDETLPPWCRLVGVGRRFDGEAGNVCIKGDASAHTPDSCAAPEFMGQDPGILRGKILARRRIRGMRRFNKPRRPKLRILMLDPAGLACAS
ncbi:hypothetical protein F2Q68_00025201 [Brassica cretica]|uniref:Uncharacterized protein n=1 Tax=Brassica cretica TaxID=69181 RepID=A0A8S9I9L3_BRACR|nr:hypothetical protein F2Q68_00025201 [Brassica cretica]